MATVAAAAPPITRRCPRCESVVRIVVERSATVFYVCDSCRTQGADSASEDKPAAK